MKVAAVQGRVGGAAPRRSGVPDSSPLRLSDLRSSSAAPYRDIAALHTLGTVPTHDERLRVPWTWWPVVIAIVLFGALEVGSGFSFVVLVPVAVFLFGFFVVPL